MRQGLRSTFLGMHFISIDKPLLSGHPLELARCPLNRGDRWIEVIFTLNMGSKLREIDRQPLDRGLLKRFDCKLMTWHPFKLFLTKQVIVERNTGPRSLEKSLSFRGMERFLEKLGSSAVSDFPFYTPNFRRRLWSPFFLQKSLDFCASLEKLGEPKSRNSPSFFMVSGSLR